MRVEFQRLSARDWGKAAAAGVATGIILAVINVIALTSHLSPLPKPLGLAFAETVLGRQLPLPVGLLFHLAWVTLVSVGYVVWWRDALTLKNTAILAFGLWLLVLLVFFPIVGWGLFGLAISPKLIVPAAVSHALFAVILWGMCRLLFGEAAGQERPQPKTA
jgi:hypothetical protein